MKITYYLYIIIIFTGCSINPNSLIHNNSNSSDGIKFVQESDAFNIIDQSKLTDEEFKKYESVYKDVINKNFTSNQTRSIVEIIFSDSENFFVTSLGKSEFTGICLTKYLPTRSYIVIAVRNEYHIHSLVHECCHALYHKNKSLFNKKYKKRWQSINGYVSEYAKTNIEEDFAETGATYLLSYHNKIKIPNKFEYHEKIKLFQEFYLETK
jgi:hypothetical protein